MSLQATNQQEAVVAFVLMQAGVVGTAVAAWAANQAKDLPMPKLDFSKTWTWSAQALSSMAAQAARFAGKAIPMAASHVTVKARAQQVAQTQVTESLMRLEHHVRVSFGLDPRLMAMIKLITTLIFADRVLGKLTVSPEEKKKQSMWTPACAIVVMTAAYCYRAELASMAQQQAITACRRLAGL